MSLCVRVRPLKDFMAGRQLTISELGRTFADHYGLSTASSERTVCRLLSTEFITLDSADRLTISMGLNPASIWGDEWWQPVEARVS